MQLSILDLSPIDEGSRSGDALRNSIALAQAADRLGYTRYWLAEHHNAPQLANAVPEIMISQIARETTRIRVGSGGVMLPNHAPLRVAESFRTLEALFPGRIDLGLGRAPGTDPRTALALRRTKENLGAGQFPALLDELLAITEGTLPDDHPFRGVQAVPIDVPLPPIWLLGSSDFSARQAAERGLGFCFAYHFDPHEALGAMQAYRENFRPSRYLGKPMAILAASVVCAESEEQVEYLFASMALNWAWFLSGRPGPIPSPETARTHAWTEGERTQASGYRRNQVLGTPEQVRERLLALVEETQADELMLTTSIYGVGERVRMYELLARTFGL